MKESLKSLKSKLDKVKERTEDLKREAEANGKVFYFKDSTCKPNEIIKIENGNKLKLTGNDRTDK
ncbi:hypothetical protein [Sphingobacterium sp.]|uniref:hypothetical protein n=1 Tax=Sphingobacterium sp. TaxID=341027 RepID=UPI0028B05333|nr:hypothetical protein [Sphingobacterium sp.]